VRHFNKSQSCSGIAIGIHEVWRAHRKQRIAVLTKMRNNYAPERNKKTEKQLPSTDMLANMSLVTNLRKQIPTLSVYKISVNTMPQR